MSKIFNLIKENKFLVVILLISAAFRFYKINLQSLWMDEIYTMNVSNPNYSLGTVITEVNNREGFPYLYFLTLNFLQSIFGASVYITRGISAIFGVLSVLMIYKLGKSLFNKNAGYAAALLITFNEYCIVTSQEARPYTMYMFAIIATYYYLVKYIQTPDRSNAIKYGLSIALLLNFNFFATINVLAQGLFLLFYLYTKNFERIYIKQLFISFALGIVFFIPNIYKFFILSKYSSFWIPLPVSDTNANILKEILGNSEITLFFLTPLFVYFLLNLFKLEEIKEKEILKNKLGLVFLLFISWGLIFFLVLFLKTYTQKTSLFIIRYFSSLIPLVILTIAISLALIKNKIIRNTYLFIILLFSFFNLTIVRAYYRGPSKTQFREASQLIIDKNKNQEPVYTSLKYWYDYYLNNNDAKFNVIEKPNLDAIVNEMIADSTKIKPFWYTDAHGRPFKISETQQQFIDTHFYVDENFDGMDAWTKHFILLKDVKKDIDISMYNPIVQTNGSPFRFSIETFENTNNQVKLAGWAYFENQEAKDSKIEVVLLKEGETRTAIKMITQKVNRPDVTTYFESKFDISNSGFASTYDTKGLPKGNYKIAVLVENLIYKKKGMSISDKYISIE